MYREQDIAIFHCINKSCSANKSLHIHAYREQLEYINNEGRCGELDDAYKEFCLYTMGIQNLDDLYISYTSYISFCWQEFPSYIHFKSSIYINNYWNYPRYLSHTRHPSRAFQEWVIGNRLHLSDGFSIVYNTVKDIRTNWIFHIDVYLRKDNVDRMLKIE